MRLQECHASSEAQAKRFWSLRCSLARQSSHWRMVLLAITLESSMPEIDPQTRQKLLLAPRPNPMCVIRPSRPQIADGLQRLLLTPVICHLVDWRVFRNTCAIIADALAPSTGGSLLFTRLFGYRGASALASSPPQGFSTSFTGFC